MKHDTLENMKKGWFIGNFEPSLCKTNACEVAVKQYKKGDYEEAHYHKIATEYTVIILGTVIMNGVEYSDGDIITIAPHEATDFRVISDTAITVVVKLPGATNDKYHANGESVHL